jgi:ProQ/FINO family
MTTKSDTNIALLAIFFPAVFSSEPWQPHCPLKVGIGDDLVARSVLGAREINAALKGYVNRLMYQKCLAAEADSERAVSRAAMPPLVTKPKAIAMPPPVQMTPPVSSGRLGLADLKRAAQERRTRQKAVAPVHS